MSSKYESLPIYKKSLDLAVHFEKVVAGFSRYHKYTVGTELRDLSRKILFKVAKANKKEHRVTCLAEVLESLENLKILIHLCRELKAFKSAASFEFAVKSVVEVSKQCEGWLRSQNQAGTINRPESASFKSLGARPTPRGYENSRLVYPKGSPAQGRKALSG